MSNLRPVILFCGALAGDGVARNTVHLANALFRRGVSVEVVCLKGGALAAELVGPKVSCLGAAHAPRALALALAVPALRRRLREADASVVVSMGNHAHLALWAALRGAPDLPRIYRISNDIAHGLGARLRALGMRLVAADATRLICVSRHIASSDVFRRARRDRRLDILPNGVDAQAVRVRCAAPPCHPWIEEGVPYLVSVGRVHRQKNYETLIDALAQLRAGRHPDLRLMVLGAASARRQAALAARARARGVEQALRFEGEIADPFPLVRRARAYVLPSRWEGASNSLLEALACGVPVVASRMAGNAGDVLADGLYGVLADPEDADDLAAAIARQLDPRRCVYPGNRAEALSLESVVARLSSVVLSARLEHDENQIRVEVAGHATPLSGSTQGLETEYGR